MEALDKLDALKAKQDKVAGVRKAFRAFRSICDDDAMLKDVEEALKIDMKEGPGIDRSGTAADTDDMKDLSVRAALWETYLGGFSHVYRA